MAEEVSSDGFEPLLGEGFKEVIGVDATVQVALITALTGFVGAVLGATAAVVGPLVVNTSNRRAVSRAESHEARRLAIVRWAETQLALAAPPAMRFTRRPDGSLEPDAESGQAEIAKRSMKASAALVELLSVFSEDQERVARFVSDVSGQITLLGFPIYGDERTHYISHAADTVLAWHRGSLAMETLIPFAFDPEQAAGTLTFVDVTTWPEASDIRDTLTCRAEIWRRNAS